MGKTKFLALLLISLLGRWFWAKPVSAISPQVSISKLGEYINTNTFRLSYSALTDNPSDISAQFYFRKEGGNFSVLGPVIGGASGEIEVTGAQVNEQLKYYFRVEINSGAAGDETSSKYDISGPSPVQNYWKERVNPGFYRLHWKNSGDTDFSRVFIYRSDTPSFTADGAHKIGETGGAPDAEVSWDNLGLDTSKEYYYALRAVDKADNSAGLVADVQTEVQTSGGVLGATTQTNTGQAVNKLPKEQVLSKTSEASSPTPSSEPQNLVGAASEANKDGKLGLSLAIAGVILLVASGYYFLFVKRNI